MTAPYILDITSLSVNQLKADLKIWAKSLPDYNKYKLFYEDEAGEILFTVIAGFAAYCAYNDLVSSKETFLNYCVNRNSAIGITSAYSYNAFRGKNIHVSLRITPNKTLILTKYDQIGVAGGLAISPVANYNIIAGQPITIECVIGDILSLNLLAPNEKLYIFRYAQSKISEDIKLELNGIEVPITTNIKNMLKDYWYVQSNAFGGVDAYYLNQSLINPIYPYTTGDTLTLTYIKHQNLTNFNFPDDIKLIADLGAIDDLHIDTAIINNFITVESIESIKINGPIHNETGDTVKSREDYPKFFKILNSEFTDTSSRDVYLPVIYLGRVRAIPAFLDLSYVKSDDKLLTTLEQNALLTKLIAAGARTHNIPDPEIIKPKKVDLKLNLTLTAKPNQDTSTITDDLISILNYYYDERNIKRFRQRKFNYIFNLNDLEHDIERLSYIKIARAEIFTKPWATSTNFKRGEFILPTVANGYMYEVINDTYQVSGLYNNNVGLSSTGTQPIWSTTPNQFVYEGVSAWTDNTNYSLGTIVKANSTFTNFLYRVKQAGTSSSIEPSWNAIPNTLNTDNNIIWEVISPYEVTTKLVYKTHRLNQIQFNLDWNEYFVFNYGNTITWQ